MNSIRTLLAGLVDYAGLFPPAALDMPRAVRNYAAYRKGENGWALARFILPGARIAEFEQAAEQSGVQPDSSDPWPISLSAGGDPRTEIDRMRDFNRRHAASKNGFAIDTIEVKVQQPSDIRDIARLLPFGITAYFEAALTPNLPDLLSAMADTGTRAKFRTGGLSQEMFPSPSDLVRFMQCCASAKVPFKASAGLHHPIRSVYKLTYDPQSPSGMMHGFINVFLAAALVYSGGSPEQAVALLEEKSPGAFHFDKNGVSWGGCRLEGEQMLQTRKVFAISVGSCSFEEPISEVKALHWL